MFSNIHFSLSITYFSPDQAGIIYIYQKQQWVQGESEEKQLEGTIRLYNIAL